MRATVEPLSEPGHAVLRIGDLEASPDGLSLSIQRQQGPDAHLAEDGWRRTETWLEPARVRRSKGLLEFDLGPEICDRLAGIATVRLRVREPDIGVVGSTVVAWPSMLTSGAIHLGARAIEEAPPRPVEAAPPVPEPVEPPPPKPAELRATRDPDPRRSGSGGWIFATVVAVLLTAGGAYAYWHYTRNQGEFAVAATTPPAAAVAVPRKSIRESVAELMATKPTAAAMATAAKAYVQAGDLQGAFLVWRHAAEAGSADAQLELAAFFDPLATPPKAGFTPDGARAAEWYERAALAGLPEAQRKFGLLLAKGGAGLAPDPAKARTWLRQAAEQNDADARKALDALPK